MRLTVESRFAGPPAIGHGGYVAGALAERWPSAVQVTLWRPTPLDVELTVDTSNPERSVMRHGGDDIAEATPATLDLDVPAPPTFDQAAGASATSPSRTARNGLGVHPTCFGCGLGRDRDDGLRIAAGPIDEDVSQVADVWTPSSTLVDESGEVAHRFVVAALDCPGAFAFIAAQDPVGLLGRIVVEQIAPVRAGEDYLVIGWRVGADERKRFAGTALFDTEGAVVGRALATWFPMPSF